jgi:voltage-gated sodium channel
MFAVRNRLNSSLRQVVESSQFSKTIAALILINAVTLGLETSENFMDDYGLLISVADKIILGIFVIEISVKLYIYKWGFFRVGWNVLDFIIISISLVPAVTYLSVMRSLRIFRVLRLITVMPQLRSVIAALLYAIPGMVSVISVLMIIFYIAAVLTTQIFGAGNEPEMKELFGTIGDSMYTLFQLMTLEGWHENIAAPTMKSYPWAWAFFIPFIIITTFAVLNLFIGIIVDAMNLIAEDNAKKAFGQTEDDASLEKIDFKITRIDKDLQEVKRLLAGGGTNPR